MKNDDFHRYLSGQSLKYIGEYKNPRAVTKAGLQQQIKELQYQLNSIEGDKNIKSIKIKHEDGSIKSISIKWFGKDISM